MAQRKDIDGSTSVPTFYGKELRWQRERAGLSLEALVAGSFYGKSLLSDIERGKRRMPLELARHVDRTLRTTDGFFERRCEDVRKARLAGCADYAFNVFELEGRAQDIDEWDPNLIPGPAGSLHQVGRPGSSSLSLGGDGGRQDRGSSGASLVGRGAARAGELDRAARVNPAETDHSARCHGRPAGSYRGGGEQAPDRCAGSSPGNGGPAASDGHDTAHDLLGRPASYVHGGDVQRVRAAALAPGRSLRLIEQAAEGYRNGKYPKRVVGK